MSKKMKFFIGLIIILVVIGLTFGIATLYRFYKLQGIWSKVKDNVQKDNFYMEVTISNKGILKKTQTYYKEGIGKFVSNDGTYIWFDGTNAYSIDEINKTVAILDKNESIGVAYKESFASLYPGYADNFINKLMLAGNLSNKIKTDYYNGQKCTIIIINEKNYTKTYWITKNLCNLVKAELKFSNGDVYEYKYNIKFHSTKLKDLELPNISEYTIIDNSTTQNTETNNNELKNSLE